ncbi:hypothetical protein GBAR_LOCUS3907 [Geodia barretti]|uniref:Uncharacterized protein n=1 Tax=Geodia barretti TaxID=519541 RepID=A0AA35R4U7_GEOBA|nr:hypothetical protein GBAR_LOCUS3907 [Geodia barretti]
MSGDLSEPHRVPGCELDQFEDDSLIQSTLPKTELKNGKIICDGPTQLPLSQQIKSGEENVNFLKTNQAATSARNGEDKFMVSDLDFIQPPPEEEDHSCSSGSSTVSEDMSFSDSGDSVEVPEFMDATEHKSEKLSAAMNEVVTGIQHTFYTPEKSCGENIAIHQACPEQQQQVPNSSAGCGPPLVTPNKWPLESSLPDQHNHHQLQKTPEEDDYATIFQTLSVDEGNPAKDIMRIDSLPVPQQGDSRQGNLVIGLSQLPTNLEPALISPDIILEPNHFLEKGVSIMGKSLNPIVTSLHNDPGSRVKLYVRTKTEKQKTQKGCHSVQNEGHSSFQSFKQPQVPGSFRW